jgi:propanol-preferring alcohol dehydrogenase
MANHIPTDKKSTATTYKKIPVPQPAADEVLVNVKYSGVCHTDLHARNGDWPLATKPLPLVGGHEGAGFVVQLGELVSDLKIGQKVGIKWINGSCLACPYCQRADEPLCAKASLSGYTVDGTFQQYAVAKAAHVARIPDECDLESIAPVLCAGITVYKGLKESGAKPGDTIAIVGAGGGLGSLAVQYAAAMGLHAIGIDGGDEKKKLVEDLGAQTYIDFTKTNNLVADVKAATPDGLGPSACLLLAVSEKPFQQATEYVRSRGVVVCIGLPANASISAPVFDTVVRMINIKGSYVGNRADTAEAIDFFRRGLIKVPIKTVGLSELQHVYELMEAGKIAGRYVVDTSK